MTSEARITSGTPFFGGRLASTISTADVRQYVVKRQGEGAANATISRELAVLKRGFSLGVQAGKLLAKPHIPMLRENNVRKGFFELEQFEAVRGNLPVHLPPVVTFCYITGWNIYGEVLPLQWRNVDFKAGVVRLDAGTTKSGDGRVFPMTSTLRTLLESQRQETRRLERKNAGVIPWVFTRNGNPIKKFRRAWLTACRRAGFPGLLVHDFRRTAVRNLVRSGVPEQVAMAMVGHRTRAVFSPYNITSERDLRDAAERLEAFHRHSPGDRAPARVGTLRAQRSHN